MKYDEMIQTECTDERYEAWTEYRNMLTKHIMDGVGHYYRKEKLNELGARRLPKAYHVEELLSEQTRKPTLAIWGAGGGNDMDLPRLANDFRIVLIDHNMEQLQKTCKRFELTKEQCICVDLKFWDITDDDYRMLEAMLKDGCMEEELVSYLYELVEAMPQYNYEELPKFDFSVCVGLASQLNARLATLFSLYGRGQKREMVGETMQSARLFDFMQELNRLAVYRLADAIFTMTGNAILFGYEVMSIEKKNESLVKRLVYESEAWERGDTWPPFDLTTEISGNDVLSRWIEERVCMGKIVPQRQETMVWPFFDQRHYLMLIGSFFVNSE